MILTILKGEIATSKTTIANGLIRESDKKSVFLNNTSLAFTKSLIEDRNFEHIILDECEDKKIINYLKNKATSIFLITCERIK